MLNHEKNIKELLLGVDIPEEFRVNDYYDISDWRPGPMGCIGCAPCPPTCEWCNYLRAKGSDPLYRELSFRVPISKKQRIEDIIKESNSTYTSFEVNGDFKTTTVYGLYPTNEYYKLKELLVSIGCTLSDQEIIALDLGSLERYKSCSYDQKLATVKKIKNPGYIGGLTFSKTSSIYGKGIHYKVKMAVTDIPIWVPNLINVYN